MNWAGGGGPDIWIDLDGLADELLLPTDRIVVQPADHFCLPCHARQKTASTRSSSSWMAKTRPVASPLA